jgi:choline dehydrogenase-like flavoprotein
MQGKRNGKAAGGRCIGFPTQISGNPHAAVIMLGEKVSRIILESDTHAEGVAQSKCA